MTAARVHESKRATSALPPVYDVPSGKKWRERHHAPRPSFFARLFARASSTLAHNPTPASIEDDARVKGISK